MSYIWLSHVLEQRTPLYGGVDTISIKSEKSIHRGDSCNTSYLALPSHSGTHVDAPRHFIEHGKCIDQYAPDELIFSKPVVLDCRVREGQIITENDLDFMDLDEQVDFVLIRSGFEKFRFEKPYWEKGPCLDPEIADQLLSKFPSLRAVGMDFISISSLAHRELGRKVHKAFLSKGLLIFEDMALAGIKKDQILKLVIALPLRFECGDGAPATIIGKLF